MQERRKNLRSRCYLGGRIIFDQRFSDVDCLVRNLAQNGARLTFASPSVLPAAFTLKIPQRQESLAVSLAWRTEGEAGVMFNLQDRSNIIPFDTALEARTEAAQQAILARRIAQIVEHTDA